MNEVVATENGQAVVEFKLLIREGQETVLSKNVLTHMSSTLNNDINQAATYTHLFRLQNPDFVDNVLRQANSKLQPRLVFRFGLGTPGNAIFQSWQNHYITGYSASLEGAGETSGHILCLRTSDVLYMMREIQTKTVARKGRISDIVAQIASENGIKDMVIEQTSGTHFLLIQSFMSDEEFIRQRCLPRAVNDKGRGNYCFHIRDNVLHFHSADYEAAVKQFHFFRPESMSFAEHDRSHELFGKGASGVRLIQYNPLTGLSREIVNDPEKSLRFSNLLYPIANLTNSHLILFDTVGANWPDEAIAIAQNAYDVARNQIFRAVFEMDRLILFAGDLVRVNVASKMNTASSWGGYYWLISSTHTIKNQAIVSSYTMQRGETTSTLGDQVYVREPSGQLLSENEAPGQDLNVAEASASSVTKGAGSAINGGTFLTMKNPKTG